MNSNRYPMINYVPDKPKTNKRFYDLHDRLKQMSFDEIDNDPKTHFENVYITNFDLIHNSARGDPLSYSKKFYETISLIDLKKIKFPYRDTFVAAGFRSQRNDVFFEKNVIEKHFKKDDIELKLMEKGVFLSSMKKNTYLKNTDNCKSLFF